MPCPDETQIARLLDGTLGPIEVARIDAHTDTCVRCRALMADLVQARSTASTGWLAAAPEPPHEAPESAPAPTIAVGRRYTVQELIGQGSMGRVYRAFDRLAGRTVALKQLRLSQQADAPVLAALAREFRALAALRHPHVVGVLDYGFDAERRPYFTMDLIEGARPLLPFAAAAPRAAQVEVLAQLLRALAYLHRCGVVHRDLKPSNLLVSGEHEHPWLEVVDFGLAAGRYDARLPAGTPRYMAPELFLGGAASEASDLYSVGVIAYEMLAGRHPFHPVRTASELVRRVTGEDPDLAPLPPDLRGTIGSLLHRSPRDRADDASAVLRELLVAAGMPDRDPAPSLDSRLAAARFTGRDEELERLSAALLAVQRGQGSVWLVGGESGAGKSRLLEELRAQALVQGVLVARGQAVSSGGGGGVFPVFRGVLEVLALHVALSDLEASVLGTVLPGLGALLERDVAPPPEIHAAAARLRLLGVLRDVVQRSRDPLLILLEDLQWADAESLSLLAEIAAGAGALPLLVAASYRDEEAPRLPAALPCAEVLRVGRFERASVALLCASMIGPAGREPALVDLVLRETEGNAYFIVETLRALAEDSGGLDSVGRRAVPERILSGGVEQVLARRLARAPAEARPLLRAAAVAGRQLDLDVLRSLVPRLQELVQACLEAGVLEAHEQRYRYSHDKLRERVLRDIDAPERRALQGRVAGALAATYPGSAEHAAAIAHHYREADRPAEAAPHDVLAGEAALARGAPAVARAAFERAIASYQRSLPPRIAEVRAFRGLAQASFGLGRLADTDVALRRVFALSGAPMPETKLGFARAIARRLAEHAAWRTGLRRLLLPRSAARRALGEEQLMALSVQEIYLWLGRPDMLLLTTLSGLNLEDALSSHAQTSHDAAMAVLLAYTPFRALAWRYLERGARFGPEGTRAEIDHLRSRALLLINEGHCAEAIEIAARAVESARARRDDVTAMHCLFQLQTAVIGADDFPRALAVARELEQLARRTENARYVVFGLLAQGGVLLRFGRLDEVEGALGRAREMPPHEIDDVAMAVLQSLLALTALRRARWGRAEALARAGLGLLARQPWTAPELRLPLHCILDVYLSLDDPVRRAGEVEQGLSTLRQIARRFPPVGPTAHLFEGRWKLAQGRTAAGAKLLYRALSAAERGPSCYDLAVTRYALGCLARSPAGSRHVPEGAELHLREAARLFERLEAPFETRAARAVLQGSRPPPWWGPSRAGL